MVVTALPISLAQVIPITRAKSSDPRPAEVVLAELHAENQRHAAVRDSLLGELAGVQPGQMDARRGGYPGELRQTKKQAARALGISEKRLDSLIARFHRDHPDQPKLAVQPDGNKYGRWIVNTERVRVVLYDEQPI